MARITVEDCLKKIDSQYDLVLLAKERAAQLNSGEKPLVSEDNDKNTVISLREIGEGKISLKTLEDIAIFCSIYAAISIIIVLIFRKNYKPVLQNKT